MCKFCEPKFVPASESECACMDDENVGVLEPVFAEDYGVGPIMYVVEEKLKNRKTGVCTGAAKPFCLYATWGRTYGLLVPRDRPRTGSTFVRYVAGTLWRKNKC